MSTLELGGRGGTIGGTSWGALLGLSRWKTPHDIWMRVKGLEEEIVPNEAMKDGLRLEPIVSHLAQLELGGELLDPAEFVDADGASSATVRWPKPFGNFSASIDRMMYNDGKLLGPVELKTMSSRGTWGDGPVDYMLQLQSYIWCHHLWESEEGRECNWGALVGLQAPREVFRLIRTEEDAEKALACGAAELRVNIVERDPEFMTQVVPYFLRWWQKYVVGNEPPPVDATDACTKALQAHYAERSGEVEATEDIWEVAAERESVRLQLSKLGEQKTELDNKLRSLLGTAKLAQSERVKVSITPMPGQLRFDQGSFKKEHPLIWKNFQRRGRGFDRISVKLRGEA